MLTVKSVISDDVLSAIIPKVLLKNEQIGLLSMVLVKTNTLICLISKKVAAQFVRKNQQQRVVFTSITVMPLIVFAGYYVIAATRQLAHCVKAKQLCIAQFHI